MMEIAIYVYDDEAGEIIDEFSSLVNPGKNPDPYVQKMTGITPKMLKRAPKFHEIAKRIVEITDGSILTAHNAAYDYAMLQKEFQNLGYDFNMPVLDTVALSQHLMPEIKSHGLDKLAKTLKIPATDRHRAFGDAKATVEILKILLQKDPTKKTIQRLIRYPGKDLEKKEIQPKEMKLIEKLPHKSGILSITDRQGKPLYIVYTRNLRLKAEKILSSPTPKFRQMGKLLWNIHGEVILSDLIGKIITQRIRRETNPPFSPYHFKPEPVELPLKNALLYHKGRNVNEKSVILIENGKLTGYAFVNLDWQTENTEQLKQRLTLLNDCPYGRQIIARKLKKNYFSKIKLLDEKTASD
jgi:DNA polymerase-3 subunit epsilon